MLNAYRNNTGGNVTDTELIVASIVQMETRSPEHMSMIARHYLQSFGTRNAAAKWIPPENISMTM